MLSCFSQFNYGLLRLPDQDYGLTAGVTVQQGMLTPPRHLIPPLVCPGVCFLPTLVFCILFRAYEIVQCSLSLPLHLEKVVCTCFQMRCLMHTFVK